MTLEQATQFRTVLLQAGWIGQLLPTSGGVIHRFVILPKEEGTLQVYDQYIKMKGWPPFDYSEAELFAYSLKTSIYQLWDTLTIYVIVKSWNAEQQADVFTRKPLLNLLLEEQLILPADVEGDRRLL